jgi:hypothetical protein
LRKFNMCFWLIVRRIDNAETQATLSQSRNTGNIVTTRNTGIEIIFSYLCCQRTWKWYSFNKFVDLSVFKDPTNMRSFWIGHNRLIFDVMSSFTSYLPSIVANLISVFYCLTLSQPETQATLSQSRDTGNIVTIQRHRQHCVQDVKRSQTIKHRN